MLTFPHSVHVTSGGLVWRSLSMLRAVRGLIGVSLLLGVIASALPYVSAAAFGPMVQVIAEAGEKRKPQRGMGFTWSARR